MTKIFKETKELAMKGDLDSKYNLGHMYAEGKEVGKDDEKSIFWYQEAAKQGHKAAQVVLGKI